MIYDFYDVWSHGTWWMILWVKTNWTSNFIFGKNLQSWHGHGTFVKWSLQWYILMRLLGLEASSEACTASAANMFRCHGAMHVNNECFIILINHMTCQQNMFLSQFTFTLHTFNFSSHLLLPTHGSPGCAWPVTVTALHFSSCPWHSKRDSPCSSFGRPSLPSRNVPEEQWDGPRGRSCPRCEVPPQCGEVLSSIGFDYLHDSILSTGP